VADPIRALTLFHELLSWTRTRHVTFWELRAERELAAIEAAHGDPSEALALFSDLLHEVNTRGLTASYGVTMASLAVLLHRRDDLETATILYGASHVRGANHDLALGLNNTLDHLRNQLGTDNFDALVATGSAMDNSQAIDLARHAIQQALSTPTTADR
jgi:hypothetical protein